MMKKLKCSMVATVMLACSLFVFTQESINTTQLEMFSVGIKDVHAKVSDTVVTVYCRVQITVIIGGTAELVSRTISGSGVIIDDDGYIITNDHVVAGADDVWVTFCGSDVNHPAVILETDPQTDLAVIKLSEEGKYLYAPLGRAENVQVGELAIAFGAPYGLSSTMTVGVISATGRSIRHGEFEYRDLLQTDASINQGNSGGPLVNIRGEVIGINFMIFSPGEGGGSVGLGFAIPMNDYVKRIVATLATGEQFTRGKLGVTVRALTDNELQRNSLSGGVVVLSVEQSSAAQRGGIIPNDIIVGFNSIDILKVAQLTRTIEEQRVGENVSINIIRNNIKMTVQTVM